MFNFFLNIYNTFFSKKKILRLKIFFRSIIKAVIACFHLNKYKFLRFFKFETNIIICGLNLKWKISKLKEGESFARIDSDYTVTDLWAPFGGSNNENGEDTESLAEVWIQDDFLDVLNELDHEYDITYLDLPVTVWEYLVYKVKYFIWFPYHYWNDIVKISQEPLIQLIGVLFILTAIFVDFETYTLMILGEVRRRIFWYRPIISAWLDIVIPKIEDWYLPIANEEEKIDQNNPAIEKNIFIKDSILITNNIIDSKSIITNKSLSTSTDSYNNERPIFHIFQSTPTLLHENWKCRVFEDRLCCKETCCKNMTRTQLLLSYQNITNKEPVMYFNNKKRLLTYSDYFFKADRAYELMMDTNIFLQFVEANKISKTLHDKDNFWSLKHKKGVHYQTIPDTLQLYTNPKIFYRQNLYIAYVILILNTSSILNPKYLFNSKLAFMAELNMSRVHRHMDIFYNIYVNQKIFIFPPTKLNVLFFIHSFRALKVHEDIFNLKRETARWARKHVDDVEFWEPTQFNFEVAEQQRLLLHSRNWKNLPDTQSLHLDAFVSAQISANLSHPNTILSTFKIEDFHPRTYPVATDFIFTHVDRTCLPGTSSLDASYTYKANFNQIVNETDFFKNVSSSPSPIAIWRRVWNFLNNSISEPFIGRKPLSWKERAKRAVYVDDGRTLQRSLLVNLFMFKKPIIKALNTWSHSTFLKNVKKDNRLLFWKCYITGTIYSTFKLSFNSFLDKIKIIIIDEIKQYRRNKAKIKRIIEIWNTFLKKIKK